MKRRKFIAGTLATVASVCACNQKQKARYNPQECPFCKGAPGQCIQCSGSGKCPYCKGTGKRMTQTMPEENSSTQKIILPETCSFCGGTGKCHSCNGSGKCRVCKGSAKIEKWEW